MVAHTCGHERSTRRQRGVGPTRRIAWPTHIRVAPDGKYWRIIARRIDGIEYDVNLRRDWRSQPKPEIDDTVPY
jgi:hypothetical protein